MLAIVITPLLCSIEARSVDIDLARYATAKENQVREYAQTLTNKVPGIVWSFFDAVKADDWETATNLAARINKASGRYEGSTADPSMSPALRTLIWPPISEMDGTYEQFHEWDNKWLHRFGHDIISSIPEGSIYFGGTDPGRFLISALSESSGPRDRFYILTQNQLVDQNYLDYLHRLYGQKIYVPTLEDMQTAFQSYVKDAQERLKNGHLKPGEDIHVDQNGRVQVSGQVAVMEINGLLARLIFDKNAGHEFFVEESFPLDWMYPYLSPHGLIFQLHAKPLAELSGTEISQDQAYWREFTSELIGDWLNDKTSIKEICDFVDKIYLDKDLTGFKGDTRYAKSKETQKCFSKLRSSQGGMYAWRAKRAQNIDEKIQMQQAADLAFRQAYALCPYSPEAIFRYTQLLMDLRRPDDAFLIIKTSLRLDPDNTQLQQLMQQVRKAQ
jgi:hypothetical protein